MMDRVGQTWVIRRDHGRQLVGVHRPDRPGPERGGVVAMAAPARWRGCGRPSDRHRMQDALVRAWSRTPSSDRRAFAIDAIAIDVAFITGPADRGGIIAVASPAASLASASRSRCSARPIFAASRASREWRGRRARPRADRAPARAGRPRPDGGGLGLGLTVGRSSWRMTAFASAPRGGGAGRGADRGAGSRQLRGRALVRGAQLDLRSRAIAAVVALRVRGAAGHRLRSPSSVAWPRVPADGDQRPRAGPDDLARSTCCSTASRRPGLPPRPPAGC